MTKPSQILQILRILTPEDIQRITKFAHAIQRDIKKAAGGELIFWQDEPEVASKEKIEPKAKEGKVLSFKKSKKSKEEPEESEEEQQVEEATNPDLITSDLLLWQREMSKPVDGPKQKVEAVKGYKKSTEMYVVKTQDENGKEKLKFASTDGILVNKKQA